MLSGGRDGVITVSSPSTGASLRVINDHKGAAISAIQCTSKQVREHKKATNNTRSVSEEKLNRSFIHVIVHLLKPPAV